ncbi:A-kinase anchor protein 11 isoform X3 [Ascaphus truei]|uniref:A-kinase anchor protein 11 isoform X3 n=1 Tax=Ascaphus truei TaxID=8439 RepID=UPI003F5A0EEF
MGIADYLLWTSSIMDTFTRNQGCQMKPKISVKKETFGEVVLNTMKSLLQSRKELCSVSASECLKGGKKGNVIEIMFLGLSEESGAAHIQDLAALHLDLPELIRSLHLCSVNDNEVIFLKDWKTITKASESQNPFPGAVCVMTLATLPHFKSDSLFVLLSKYTTGVRYSMEQHCLKKINRKTSHNEDDDTNQSVSSIEDDFVTAFEHLDEEESTTNEKQEIRCGIMRNQRDVASQTQPAHCLDISGSKIIFSSVRRRSSIKSATLMGFMGFQDLTSVKNTVTTSICDPWRQRHCSGQDKTILSSSPAESSESDCSSPSPIIFLDEEGYQKSLRAKLNLPKIPVVKDGIEDSDSELSEFFDSFDRFDDPELFLENNYKLHPKAILACPPKKRNCAQNHLITVSMNPQKFKFDAPTLPANIRKPTPRKPESPYSSICDVPDSPRPVKTSAEDTGTLFSPIRSSAFSPLGIASPAEAFYHLDGNENVTSRKDQSSTAYSDYANRVCIELFDSVLNSKPSINLGVSKKGLEKTTKLKRKSYNKESELKQKSKQKSVKVGIQKFATELVEKSFGSAFKDLQKGVSTCTTALCHLAARLTSYVFQMAFYEIGRRQAFSIKKRAINSLANLMVSEVITSALQELRFIKKQMFTNAVTRFAADLAEELVFEGIMEVCQFSHPPTPTVASLRSFDYDNVVVSSYAKDLSESVIQEAFIELSQVNVTFTTQAAISVSMDNLKYGSSEGMMQSTQTSMTFPNLPDRLQVPLTTGPESDKDYTVQHALFFTSGLVSSIPVPVAAKALSQQHILNDIFTVNERTQISVSDVYINTVEKSNLSPKKTDEIAADKNVLPASGSSGDKSQRAQEGNKDSETRELKGPKTFSVTMVDMIVNEAYEVTSSKLARTVEDDSELLTKKVVEIPSQHLILEGETSSNNFADDLAKCILQHSVDETTRVLLNKCEATTPNIDLAIPAIDQNKCMTQDSEMLNCSPKATEQQLMISKCPPSQEHLPQCSLLVAKPYTQENEGTVVDKHSCSTSMLNSNVSFNKMSSEGMSSKINIHNTDLPVSSMFGLQSCLSHINSFSSVMCSCGDDFFFEDKTSQRDANFISLPGTPPPTPLASYKISPDRSLKKLSKKLKGQLAKEFSPATPPSTPHLSVLENDSSRKDDFMLKLMRSLSEEVESTSSDDNYEDVEVSEETFRYADYLSSQIISMSTEIAAYCLDDESAPVATVKNKSLLSVLSDKWGHPAYMRNITEETLETLCIYAGGISGEIIDDAKKALSKRQYTLMKKFNCDVDCRYFRKRDKDCRPKERGCTYTCMTYKEVDPCTLSLPQNNFGAGLTSKYPSCESVTEEYADHIIRVLKKEGGNRELIMDQYASRLAYSAIKFGLQQASKNMKLKRNRRIVPRRHSEANSTQEILRLLSRTHHQEKPNRGSVGHHSYGEEPFINGKNVQRPEFIGLLHFAETLAHTITCDVRRKLKMSAASLPKSLTDSCLYTKSKIDDVTGDLVKTSFSKTLLPISQNRKLYHSTGSLNENGFSESIIQTIEQYACKVVDNTLEIGMETARLQAVENRKHLDKIPYAGKLVPSYGTACGHCSAKEQQCYPLSSCHSLLGQEASRKIQQPSKSKHNNACQKSRRFHLNVPKIHIDRDKRAIFAEKIVSAAIEKAERELSNTSLAADSGIGHDGISFAESLTTGIMMSTMKTIGHVVNMSSNGRDGFQSADSVTSQQTSVSVGDDSTGSWSNLSFEDEHHDESSSFLHLSDSDSAEEKNEDPKVTAEAIRPHSKILLIRNIDVGPSTVDSQLRTTLQWIVASESDISDLYFPETARKELLALSRRLRERDWKVGDLLQAVLQYYDTLQMSPSDINKSLFGWLLENS